VTAYPTWTPAPRPGIIPLQPLGFGTILGRSFSALRQNPKVLLGFALVVQTVGTLLATAGIVAAAALTFSRLAALRPGTEEFEAVLAGSIAITAVVSLVLTLAAMALSVLVQGVVVSEVAHAVVAEKLTLGRLWRRVKPVAWRLIGYTLLVLVAVLVVLGGVTGVIVALALSTGPLVVIPIVLIVLATVPLTLWLSTKLLLVPAALVLEHTTIFRAIGRSWRLTRGRFWVALGITLIISTAFGTLAQVVTLPFSILSMGLTTVISPTGDPDVGSAIAVLIGSFASQVLVLLVQSVALVVQSTATSLIYIDCRMRHEGLDLDLLAYVDRRDSGATDLPDPYHQNIGRLIAPRWMPAAPGRPAAPGPHPHGYAPPPYPAAPPPYAGAAYPPPDPGTRRPGPGASSAAPPASAVASGDAGSAPAGWTAPAATEWTPPGGAERP